MIGPETEITNEGMAAHLHGTNLQVGKALYEHNCSRCHGADRRAGQTNPALAAYPSLFGLQFDRATVEGIIATGIGTMPEFSYLSEAQRAAIAAYVLDLQSEQNKMFLESTQSAMPAYYRIPYKGIIGKFLSQEGYPGIKPPWGQLTAINLNTGKAIWTQTIGDYPELKAKGIHAGSENFGAPVVTAGGIVFMAATRDAEIRGFDKLTGQLLWEADLPAAGIATPAVYQANGKEYVVIACGGGGKQLTKSGDKYVAFALPDAGMSSTRNR